MTNENKTFNKKVKCPYCKKVVNIIPLSTTESLCSIAMLAGCLDTIPNYSANLVFGSCSNCGQAIQMEDDSDE